MSVAGAAACCANTVPASTTMALIATRILTLSSLSSRTGGRGGRPDPGDVHPDAPQAAATHHVQRLAVGIAERQIGHPLGRHDCAEMLAIGRDDPDAARGGA